MFWLHAVIFVAGMFAGWVFAFVLLALCHAASRADEMAGYEE